MSTKSFAQRISLPGMVAPFPKRPENITPPQFPTFPSFPSLEDLAKQERTRQETKTTSERSSVGLFDGILRDQTVMIDDWMRHPEKYSPEAQELLRRLAHGTTSPELLSGPEKTILDLAVLDFMAPPPQPKPPLQTQKKAPAKTEEELLAEFEGEGAGEDEKGPAANAPPSLDAEGLPPYWWL